MLKDVPYQVHTILTDNGIQLAEQPRNRNTICSRQMHFDMIYKSNGIEHRLTTPDRPKTNGQVERMNCTIKEATLKRLHYDSLQLFPKAGDPQWPYALGIHLQNLHIRAKKMQPPPDPTDAGTEQSGRRLGCITGLEPPRAPRPDGPLGQ